MAVTQGAYSVVKLALQGDELTGSIDVNFLRWQNKAGGADEDLKVTDSDGNTLWVDTADGVNYDNFCPLKNTTNGVKATVMTSGELYVYKQAEIPMQV